MYCEAPLRCSACRSGLLAVAAILWNLLPQMFSPPMAAVVGAPVGCHCGHGRAADRESQMQREEVTTLIKLGVYQWDDDCKAAKKDKPN